AGHPQHEEDERRELADVFGSVHLGDAAETVDGGQGEQRLEDRGQARRKPVRQHRPEQERERSQDAAGDRPEADRAEHREEREDHGKENAAECQTDVIDAARDGQGLPPQPVCAAAAARMIPAAVTTTAARIPATAVMTAITRDVAATMRDLRRVRSRLSVIAPVRNSTPVNHAARTTRTAAAASIPRTLVDSTSSAVAAESAVPRVAGKVSTSTTAVAAAAAIVVISSCRDRGRSRSFAHSAAGIFDAMVVIAVPLPSCGSTAIRLPGRLPGGPPSRLPNRLPG